MNCHCQVLIHPAPILVQRRHDPPSQVSPLLGQRLLKVARCRRGEVQIDEVREPRRIELRADRHRILPRLQRQIDERGEHRH